MGFVNGPYRLVDRGLQDVRADLDEDEQRRVASIEEEIELLRRRVFTLESAIRSHKRVAGEWGKPSDHRLWDVL